jgi:hypothetical protein
MLVYWNAKFCDRTKLRSVLDVLCSMQGQRQPPFRWTLHYGKAIFGATVTAGELSALGQDLNFLFRMERLAAAEGFPNLVSQAAQAEMAELHQGKISGAFSLKGFEGEYQFFRW